jgi:phosphate transport system protein
MRDAYHKELESLDQGVVAMGALVEKSIHLAATAFVDNDKELAGRVRAGDDDVDAMFMDIEKRCLALMAQQAPVAGDLRLVVAILGAISEMERTGDIAYNVAKLVQRDDAPSSDPGIKVVRTLLAELGAEAQKVLAAAIDAWAQKDEAAAAAVERQDDRSDELHGKVIAAILELKGEESVAAAIRLAMLGRYFERIGDHAVNLAERVRYFVTGDAEYLG